MNNDYNLYDNFAPVEDQPGHLSPEERIRDAAVPLLQWFARNKRVLPWREDPSPYHVWLSEIMLQQTRVEAVIPYYLRFLSALPDLEALAEVEEEQLMKYWQGLGYYNRARNLKKAAGEAVRLYDGQLPGNYDLLLKLPGIGPYTAGAVASIAFGLPESAVDGNVLRVISRLLASREDISLPGFKKQMEAWIRGLLSSEAAISPGDYNQALMELGALVCIPNGAPHCEQCPWEGICLACRLDLTREIPYKAPKKARKIEEKTVFLIHLVGEDAGLKDSMVGLKKRPEKGLLAGLYEFPNEEGHLDEEKARQVLMELVKESLPGHRLRLESLIETRPAKHIFTHVEWHMKGYEALVCLSGKGHDILNMVNAGQSDRKESEDTGSLLYYSREEILDTVAIPSAFASFLKRL